MTDTEPASRAAPHQLCCQMDIRTGDLLRLRRTIQDWLLSNGVPTAKLNEILLACSEACDNAAEHAYSTLDDPWGPVAVEGRFEADGWLRVSVRDIGSWRPLGADPSRGRGLSIISSLATKVSIDRSAEGTQVAMSFNLND